MTCGLAVWDILGIKISRMQSTKFKERKSSNFKDDEKYPSCMIGKSTLENYPERLEPASRPLERVNMDSYLSSITSIKEYNHAVEFTDSFEV